MVVFIALRRGKRILSSSPLFFLSFSLRYLIIPSFLLRVFTRSNFVNFRGIVDVNEFGTRNATAVGLITV